MHSHEFLAALHAAIRPQTYVEVGVRDGASLAFSRAKSVGIDPEFGITMELHCDLHLVKATSDDYFARDDALSELGGRPYDLALIDGMHLFEYALRDFINLERHAHWSSVVVFDDMFPRWPVEAARDRITRAWAGDVYKNLLVLNALRPDLIVLPVHTSPTGTMLVLGLDPTSQVLSDRYDELVSTYVVDDPQQVPAEVLERHGAWEPAKLAAAAPIWSYLADARARGVGRDEGMTGLRDVVEANRAQAAADFTARPIIAAGSAPSMDHSARIDESAAERLRDKRKAASRAIVRRAKRKRRAARRAARAAGGAPATGAGNATAGRPVKAAAAKRAAKKAAPRPPESLLRKVARRILR